MSDWFQRHAAKLFSSAWIRDTKNKQWNLNENVE